MRVAFLTFLVLLGPSAILLVSSLSVARIFTNRFSRFWRPCFYFCSAALVALMAVLSLTYHRGRFNDDFANNSTMLMPLAIAYSVLSFVAFKKSQRYFALGAVSLTLVAFLCYWWSLR